MEILIMKKYTCFALLAFFGAAMLSPVMAVGDAAKSGNEGKKKSDDKNDGNDKKHNGH